MFTAVRLNDWIELFLLACIPAKLSIFCWLKGRIWCCVCCHFYFYIRWSVTFFIFVSKGWNSISTFHAITFLYHYMAALGGLINGFYGFQIVLFGEGTDWLTILKKNSFWSICILSFCHLAAYCIGFFMESSAV